MAILNFNAATVAPADSFDVLPAGEYKAEIVGSEMKPTSAGTGEYLNLTFKIVAGNFEGRLFWDRLNLVNPNPKAVEIAQRTLSQICHATGRINITDSSQLHNIPMMVKLVVKTDPQYGDKNETKGFKSAGVASPSMGKSPAATAATNTQAAGATQTSASPSKQAPWQKGAA